MQGSQIENEARRGIFLKLCRSEFLRYSELKPKEMESNHFSYHLKRLLNDGYVTKTEEGLYGLAPKGLRLAGQISFSLEGLREQPKVMVLIHVTSSDGSKQLVLRRNRQPHIGKFVVPGGKVHFGESMEGAANRMLEEFLPNANINMEYSGSFSIKSKMGRGYYAHMVGFVYSVELVNNVEEEIRAEAERSDDVLWVKIGDEVLRDWQSGSKEIIEAVNSGEKFNLELEYDE